MTRILRIFTDLFLGFCGVFFTTKGTEGFHEGREGFLWWWIGGGHEGVSLGWCFGFVMGFCLGGGRRKWCL